MTNDDLNKFRGVVKEEIDTALNPVNKKLDSQGKKLDSLWDQVVEVTEGMGEVKEVQKTHTASLKRIESKVEQNTDDIRKINKRLTIVENQSGIVPPPELTVTS